MASNLLRKPAAGISLAVVLLAVAAFIVMRTVGSDGPPRARPAWFYDLQTGQLFDAASSDIPPIAAPSGGEGVRAHVGSCGSCDDAGAREIHYLEKWDEPTKRSLENPDDMQAAANANTDPLVARATDDPKWARLSSDKGITISSAAGTFAETCGGSYTQCTP